MAYNPYILGLASEILVKMVVILMLKFESMGPLVKIVNLYPWRISPLTA